MGFQERTIVDTLGAWCEMNYLLLVGCVSVCYRAPSKSVVSIDETVALLRSVEQALIAQRVGLGA
jgi:hypothetical protein